MAIIENAADRPREELGALLAAMEPGLLIGQQMVIRGGIDSLEFILKNGVTEALAKQMLDDLRDQLMLLHEVANRRGIQLVGYQGPDDHG